MTKTAREVIAAIQLPTSESYGSNPEYKTLSETDADNIIHELACAGFVIVPKESTQAEMKRNTTMTQREFDALPTNGDK